MSDLIKVGVQFNGGGLPEEVKRHIKALYGLGEEAQDTSRDLGKFSKENDKAKTSIQGVATEADRSTRSLERMDSRISRGTTAISARLSGLQATQRVIQGGSAAIINRYTALGAGVAAAANQVSSAGLDKTLNRIRLTAGATREQAAALREDLFRLGGKTGKSVDDLAAGFDNLIQSGSSWEAARQQIEATNIAMAVGGANAQDLTNALGVAGTAFNIDMEKPGQALEILDKMRVAGVQGSAEMEMLSGIFARVGVNASRAGMGMDQSLAFIEVLSKVEKQPERLATLADSTLRLFTNLSYLKTATKATGVRFFDLEGNRRDVGAILGDMRIQYRKLQTDKQRAAWIQKAFGQTDIDTQKGIATLLGGTLLEDLDTFTKKISQASGTLAKELPDAVDNANDQVGRLKNSLRKAGDEFAAPINSVIKEVSRWTADTPGLAKGALITGGGIAAAAGGVVVAGKLAEAIREIRRFLGRGKGGTGGIAGALGTVAAGAEGVRVFVTNWGGIGGSVPGGPLSSGPIAAENAAAQTAARTGLVQRLFPTFSRWGSSLAGMAKGAAAGVGSKAHQLGVWAQGQRYGMERVLGRTAAGRWAMGAGSSMLQRSSTLWRNAAWGSGPLGTLSRFGTPLLRSSIGAAALGIPLEWLANGVNLRSTVAGTGSAIGGVAGWMGGAALGAATTAGVGSIPLAIGGSMAGSWAGREGALALFDWLASMKDAAPGVAAQREDFAPQFNIGVNFDAMGRPTATIDGPGASMMRVNAPRLTQAWSPFASPLMAGG